jgi:hypothetical protein
VAVPGDDWIKEDRQQHALDTFKRNGLCDDREKLLTIPPMVHGRMRLTRARYHTGRL